MPRRIILHAGFHKTGTSSIQATLRENRVALKKTRGTAPALAHARPHQRHTRLFHMA